MAVLKQVRPTEVFMGKLRHGADLLEEITDISQKYGIRLGRIEAFGAVKKARLGFYNQGSREYQSFDLDRPLEITKLIGNISLKDNHPMVHAHLTLADEDGSAYGGHLMPGTIIFACEIILQAFEGPGFERRLDNETGLPLWEME
jgi:predicted DNA-binding protein with PD1-like motif